MGGGGGGGALSQGYGNNIIMQSVANEYKDQPKKKKVEQKKQSGEEQKKHSGERRKKQSGKKRSQDALRGEELLQTGVKWFYWVGAPGVGIQPCKYENYRVFVQSTSQGSRCLKSKTLLLYKVQK